MNICIFAGTFDPITKGHEYIVNECLKNFDKVVIGVGINKDKTPYFSVEERVGLIKKLFEGKNVEVEHYTTYTVDFAKKVGAKTTVRGIRNAVDVEYEQKMADFNKSLDKSIQTTFITVPKEISKVSSTIVRENIQNKKSIKEFIPEKIYKDVMELIKRK